MRISAHNIRCLMDQLFVSLARAHVYCIREVGGSPTSLIVSCAHFVNLSVFWCTLMWVHVIYFTRRIIFPYFASWTVRTMSESAESSESSVSASGTHWKDEEILELIKIWREEEIFRETENTRSRKKPVYTVICKRLIALGILRNEKQVKTKIRSLKADYKNALKYNNTSGNDRKNMKFFNKLNEFLGHRPAINPPSGSVLETAPRPPAPGAGAAMPAATTTASGAVQSPNVPYYTVYPRPRDRSIERRYRESEISLNSRARQVWALARPGVKLRSRFRHASESFPHV